MIGAKEQYDMAQFRFHMGRNELTQPKVRNERPKRQVRPPDRFEPEFFKTRWHKCRTRRARLGAERM